MAADRPFSDARVDLGPDDLKLLKEVKVGGRVRLVIYGTLKAMSQSAGDSTSDTSEGGSMTITVSKLNLASNNEIADLLDDEDV